MEAKPTSINCMGYTVYTGTLENLLNQKQILVNTINQYSYCIAEKDASFKQSLMESDVLLPDGIGIVVATRFLEKKKISKIAGADLHHHLLKKLEKEGGRCFYLGASEETLKKIKKRVATEFPSVTVGSYSPPFKPTFSDEDNDEMLFRVNVFKPDVLFVGMTAPKQEKWAYKHKDLIDAKIICSIGAVFDFYAGTINRPNDLWIKLGLEWMGRLVKEPKRMWKRYLYYGAVFGYHILQHKYYPTSTIAVKDRDKKEELELKKV